MIPFNIPPYHGAEIDHIKEAISARKICGDGSFTSKCNHWIEEKTGACKALLTTSCTHALEMSAFLSKIQPGDEVIMPSFTFSSTANAFILRGAVIVFVDLRPDTMNIDEQKIEAAITEKTKAICVVHYAGVSCEMDTIKDIAQRHRLCLVEDAAQGVMSTYKGMPLGAIGDFGCYSFHETKNYTMGEGGALMIQRDDAVESAEILREKGTDRSKFYRGQVDKYTWRDYGSSYLPSELNAAYLWAQLQAAEAINNNRLLTWQRYHEAFTLLHQEGRLALPVIPEGCVHNAHMYYVKLKDIGERSAFISFMKDRGVLCVFHYIPLHSAPAGLKYGRFHGEDVYTTKESERLVRLPMYYGMEEADQNRVIQSVQAFFAQHG